MIYISLSLRYQRQLNVISPDVSESFFKEAAAAAKANGGVVLSQGSGAAYAFDRKGLCCVLSVFFTIEAILKLAEERKQRIKEYFIFVDSSEKEISSDEIADRMSVCDNLIIPDRAAVLTREVADLLSPYALFEAIEGSSLVCYSGSKSISESPSSAPSFLGEPFLIPFWGAKDKRPCALLLAFLNTASAISIYFNAESFLTKKELAAFNEDKKAVKRVAAMRFAATHPLYIMEACEDYLKLFFIALSRFYAETKGSETVEIAVPEGAFHAGELERFESLLSGICVFKVQKKASSRKKGNVKGSDVPPDIMDAAYLLFRAAGFIYTGEIDSFLAFLGKGPSFRDAVAARIVAAGFPLDTTFFACMRGLEAKGFPKEDDRKRLDKYLFDYLIDKCRGGFICSSEDFCERLLTLGIKVPDTLLVTAAYRNPSPAKAAEALKGRFSSPDIPAAIKELSEAEKNLIHGDFRGAQTEAKRVLQAFQKARIIAGEFEAFSFLARISFSASSISADEAFSYLNYALDNSVKMHDIDAQMRALFDFASMHFLAGNFFEAQSSVKQLREKADERYDKAWVFAACFLEGMIYFSLGDYASSEKIFTAAEAACTSLGLEKAKPLSAAWIFRSRAYQAKKANTQEYRAELYEGAPEAALFALESAAKAALDGERQKEGSSLFSSLPTEIEGVPAEGCYVPPDAWSWKSSFAFEEDRYFCGAPSSAASVFYSAFYAFCSGLYSEDEGSLASVRDSIASLVRNEMPSGSPRAYIFYYLCFELESRISGKNSAEALSFLSRAFKGVQTLAKNISDSSMREKFLTKPYWNALLYAAARENNLI